MKRFALLALATLAAPAFAQSLSLKEYTLGDPMTRCPPGVQERVTNGPLLNCMMGPTTLANQRVNGVLITIYEGRVQSVLFDLPRGHRAAHQEIFSALRDKFGAPTWTKQHVNSAEWLIGDQSIHFDGWEGAVLLEDKAAAARSKQTGASKNKSDL